MDVAVVGSREAAEVTAEGEGEEGARAPADRAEEAVETRAEVGRQEGCWAGTVAGAEVLRARVAMVVEPVAKVEVVGPVAAEAARGVRGAAAWRVAAVSEEVTMAVGGTRAKVAEKVAARRAAAEGATARKTAPAAAARSAAARRVATNLPPPTWRPPAGITVGGVSRGPLQRPPCVGGEAPIAAGLSLRERRRGEPLPFSESPVEV